VTEITIISGIRGTAEVEFFRRRFGADFILLVVDAPLETRYARARKRNRPGDNISFEEFRRIEDHERSAVSGAQEVDKVIALADFTIENDGSMDALMAKLEQLVGQNKQPCFHTGQAASPGASIGGSGFNDNVNV
jgi:dephospho-CoA kinase